MKNSKQILAERCNVAAIRKEALAKRDTLRDSYIFEGSLAKKAEKRKAVYNDIEHQKEVISDCDLKLAILSNNYVLSLFEEVKPVIISVLTKYAGKPYGEKTRAKIAEEVKSLCGCRFFINSKRFGSDYYEIYNDNMRDALECWGNLKEDHKLLTSDNKIILVSDFRPAFITTEYVDDIDERIELLKSIHAEAEAKQKELEGICSKYNALAVGTIKHIRTDDTINPWLI